MWPILQPRDAQLTTPFPKAMAPQSDEFFVFFDAGMILYDLDWNLFLEKINAATPAYGFHPETFARNLRSSGAFSAWECGTIGPSSFCDLFQKALNQSLKHPPQEPLRLDPIQIKEFSSAIVGAVRPAVATFAKRLRQLYGCGIGILSNATPWHETDLLLQCDLREHFDLVLFSQDFGLAKPHPEFFNQATRLAQRVRNPLQAENIYFVDDTPANVRGALDFGWRARLPNLLKEPHRLTEAGIETHSQAKEHLVFAEEASARVLSLFAEIFPEALP